MTSLDAVKIALIQDIILNIMFSGLFLLAILFFMIAFVPYPRNFINSICKRFRFNRRRA